MNDHHHRSRHRQTQSVFSRELQRARQQGPNDSNANLISQPFRNKRVCYIFSSSIRYQDKGAFTAAKTDEENCSSLLV